MERLTQFNKTYKRHEPNENANFNVQVLIDKLAEYEDTGLSPAEIMELKQNQLVRCKDCKFSRGYICANKDGLKYCETPNDFCSYGKLKE